jgi:hypothetical protein
VNFGWYIAVCKGEAQIVVQLPPNLVPVASTPGVGKVKIR